MQKSDLFRLISDPRSLKQEDLPAIQQLVADFPYFQAAQMLLVVASRKWDASVYQQCLKKAAITVTNRSRLFELMKEAERDTSSAYQQPVAGVLQTGPQKDGQQEIGRLQATEVAAEEIPMEQNTREVTVVQQQPAADIPEEIVPFAAEPAALPAEQETKEKTANEQTQLPGEELEKEIARNVVSAFVEKEVIDTPSLHKPLPPAADKPESFGDWLAYLKKNNGQPYVQIEEQVKEEKARQAARSAPQPEQGPDQRKKKMAIIDRIIEKNPGLIRTREETKFYSADLKAKESLLESEHLVTETLARIYALQGNINKAIRAYEILSLKYPQKSAYFATLIQQLKTNQ
jgi:hypothetical protein